MIIPGHLKPGDTIALISPAKAIEAALVDAAETMLTARGYFVLVGQYAKGQHNYFSGTVEERLSDLQWAIDHPEVKAIWCNRGGYGAIHLLEKAQTANLLREPRWLIGFSDITNFHCLGLTLDLATVHATMPLNFAENSPESLETLFSALETGHHRFDWTTKKPTKNGFATGKVVGGNLSILYSLLGTRYFPDVNESILFIEDIGEQWYAVDRMIHAFELAGVWEKVAGVIVGGMTDMKETAVPCRLDFEQTIIDCCRYRNIPIVFDAPIGHQSDNRAVIVGKVGQLTVNESEASFEQGND